MKPSYTRRREPDTPAAGPERTLAGGIRRRIFIAIAIVAPLISLVVAEGVLRLCGYGFGTSFFQPIEIEGKKFLVNSDTFSFRFFPPEQARFPGPVKMPARKEAGVIRIFVLGESAAMGDPQPAFGAARYLEALLKERFPSNRFEIVNVAFTAINSHVILPIARECAAYEGDVWIVYMGNNEMVGPFGAATVFGVQAPPARWVRLTLAVQRTRLGQALAALARRFRSAPSNAGSWGGMGMFMANRVAPGDKRKEMVYRNFEKNLRDIVERGAASGAKVLLNTVAVNLSDCPPLASICNSNASSARATTDLQAGAEADPHCADLQYQLGKALLGDPAKTSEARRRLQQACDDDALPFRADSRINGVIRKIGLEYTGRGARLLDCAEILGTNSPTGVCGAETFYEHVHFNFDGNYRLARLWASEIERVLPALRPASAADWASQEACEQRLGLSLWNRRLVYQSVERRFHQAPLSEQPNNSARLHDLGLREREAQQAMTPEARQQALENFRAAIQRTPQDHYLRENFAEFLQLNGRLEEATEQWRAVHELLPQDFLAAFQLGRLLTLQGRFADARPLLAGVLHNHAGMTEAWQELGTAELGAGEYASALGSFERALKQRPQDPALWLSSGKALAKLHRRAEAISRFRQAIQLRPDYSDAYFELGGELAFDEDIAGAKAAFEQVVRLKPDFSRGHFNLGVMFAKQNQLDQAEQQFLEALRLEPNYQLAQQYLAQVRQLKGRR